MIPDLASMITSGSFLVPGSMVDEQHRAGRSLGGLGGDSG